MPDLLPRSCQHACILLNSLTHSMRTPAQHHTESYQSHGRQSKEDIPRHEEAEMKTVRMSMKTPIPRKVSSYCPRGSQDGPTTLRLSAAPFSHQLWPPQIHHQALPEPAACAPSTILMSSLSEPELLTNSKVHINHRLQYHPLLPLIPVTLLSFTLATLLAIFLLSVSIAHSSFHSDPVCPMYPIQYPGFLFRVIRAYDVDAEAGFQCGDPEAGLTLEQHVQKGLKNEVKSQYISTTKSPHTAISWTINGECAFAIISRQALDPKIRVYDLCGDSSQALKTPWANYISTKHQEVLLTPYINKEAIVRIVSFNSHGSWRAVNSYVQHLLSPTCTYCRRRGHDVDNGDRCTELDDDNAVEEYESIQCGYCGKLGHDVGKGDCCTELDDDNAVEEYESTRCGYCGELGHDVDKGDRCMELDDDNAVVDFNSLNIS